MIECLMLCIASVLCIWYCLKKCHKKITTTTTALSNLELYEEFSYLEGENKDDEDYDELLSLLDYV